MNLKKLNQTFFKQQDQTDCGIACLLSLIRYYKGNNNLENLRRLSGTNTTGTTLLGLYQAANQLGFTAEGCESDIQSLIEHGKPVILHVLIKEQLKHYIVCYGYDEKKEVFVIGDPEKGVEELSKDEVDAIWKSRTCLVLEPNAIFEVEKKVKIKKWKWFLKLIQEDYNLLSMSLAIGIIAAALGMAMALFSQKLIDDILPSKDLKKLITGLVLLGFLLLVRVLLSSLRNYILIRQTKDFNNRIINQFFSNLLFLPKPFFDTRKIGELIARLNDTNRVQRVTQYIANNFIIELLVVLVSLIFLFYYSWETGLITLFSLPIYYYIIYQFNNTIIKHQIEVMQSYAFTESNYINTLQGISTIKNHNKQTVFNKLNQIIYGNYQNRIFDLSKINIRLSIYSGVSSVLFTMIVLSYCSYLTFYNKMSLGEFMLILSITGSLLPSISSLALVSIPINEAKVAFDRMFEFSAMEPEKNEGKKITHFDKLEINNLDFRFAGQSPLLQNINLEIKKGTIKAIIGESGSGKSTLGHLLQKYYEYESGIITVNGKIDFRELNTLEWRKYVGVVEQEIHLFNGTVVDNILIGKECEPQRVIEFCKQYGFHGFILKLPQSYETLLGENGVNLSGGQKQVIALARAIFKKPQLLILDEPTSAMDRITESFSLKLISKIKKQMTVFLISHRLHILKGFADFIYVIEDKTIKCKGTHEKLLETENFYSDYWRKLEIKTA